MKLQVRTDKGHQWDDIDNWKTANTLVQEVKAMMPETRKIVVKDTETGQKVIHTRYWVKSESWKNTPELGDR